MLMLKYGTLMRHWITLVSRVNTSLGGIDRRARKSYFMESLVVLALCLEILSYAWLRWARML